MTKGGWIGIAIGAAVVIFIVAYLIAQSLTSPASNSSNPASTTSTTSEEQAGKGPYWYQGSTSLCSQGAQEYADSSSRAASAPMPPVAQFSLTSQQSQNTAVQPAQPLNPHAPSYFVESSHYAASQNSCYFELHDLLPMPPDYNENTDTYTLYVAGGPSEQDVSLNAVIATEIAACSTYPNGQTQCGYYGPMTEEGWTIGDGNLPTWNPTYPPFSDTNPPPMSQQDFQSLVTQDMAAN